MGFRTILRLGLLLFLLGHCGNSQAQDSCCAVGGAVRVKDLVPDSKPRKLREVSPIGVKVYLSQDRNINFTITNADGVYVLYVPNDKIKQFDLICELSGYPDEYDRDVSNKEKQNKRRVMTLVGREAVKLGESRGEVEQRVNDYLNAQKEAKASGNQALADSADRSLRTLREIGNELRESANRNKAQGETSEAKFLFDRALIFQEPVEPGTLNLAKTYEDYATFVQLGPTPSDNQKAEVLAMRAAKIRSEKNAAFKNAFFMSLGDFSSYEAAWKATTGPIERKVEISPGGDLTFNVPVEATKPTSVTVVGAEPDMCTLSVAKRPEPTSPPLRPIHAWNLYGGKAQSQVVETPGKYTFRIANRSTSSATCVVRID